jgi:chromosome segregation protein
MDISKLTIQGFKSFYEKSVFTFGKNITAIVGPNGSGKSNITEAVRFVLGEQSTKSMRGKEVTDLLFRGNNTKASKAKVEIEFVKSHRQKVAPGSTENVFVKNALEKDVVVVSRTIYADGKSEYMLNGVEVRVKDLHEFLLYLHLGNKSSWHISQGEADLVLSSNPQERKKIVEDALGLKVFHARINDSLKKLEKTKENIREATYKRKEILPELSSLSKLVDRIKRSSEWRIELEQKASSYLSYRQQKLSLLQQEFSQLESVEALNSKLENIENTLKEKEKSLYQNNSHDSSYLEKELSKEEHIYTVVKSEFENLETKLRTVRNNLDYIQVEEKRNTDELQKTEIELQNVSKQGNDIVFSEKNVFEARDKIETTTSQISTGNDLSEVKNLAKDIDFTYKKLLTLGSVVSRDNMQQISYLQSIQKRLVSKNHALSSDKVRLQEEQQKLEADFTKASLKLKIVQGKIDEFRKQIIEYKYTTSETEREIQVLLFERSRIQNRVTFVAERNSFIKATQNEYNNEMHEFKMILGSNFGILENSLQVNREEEFQTLRRNIERLKIRLEESQVANPDEVMQNYKLLSDRDAFLLSEIGDLEKSMINLETLIVDLKESLKKEFDQGLLHINSIFDNYVKKLFGGGGAKVFVVEVENRKKAESDNGEQEEEEELKTGVEVEVEIPKKKVKGLHSLSGGERALVSIALNFSIVNQNPSPFMILDETDAALDEANSKRYGEILEMLKQQTKLIVVTHNRETMHFADQVYGVTLSKDGNSKVLSVSFEDAVEYAK